MGPGFSLQGQTESFNLVSIVSIPSGGVYPTLAMSVMRVRLDDIIFPRPSTPVVPEGSPTSARGLVSLVTLMVFPSLPWCF